MPQSLPSSRDATDPPQWPRLTLRPDHQVIVAVVVVFSLGAIAMWAAGQGGAGGKLVDIDRAEPIALDFKLDVNTADWPELALMPNLGEQLARRIVEDRALNGPFRDVSDLRRVRGIGPNTLEGMKPYLLPLTDPQSSAGSQAASDSPDLVN